MNFLLQTLLITFMTYECIYTGDQGQLTVPSNTEQGTKHIAAYYKIMEAGRDTYHYQGRAMTTESYYLAIYDKAGTFIRSHKFPDTGLEAEDNTNFLKKQTQELLQAEEGCSAVVPYPYSRDY